MAQQFEFDLFTIGAGSGGIAGSRRAASYGGRVGICENSRVGGTCVIRGCIPKKLLVHGAHVAEEIEEAAGFGWTIPVPTFSWPDLIAAKNREIDRLNAIYLQMLDGAGVELLEGRGRMVGPHAVQVGDRIVTAQRILIATGSRPVLPPIPGIEHAITSEEALNLPALPKRLVIVGGGYIAVEFAGIFQALGGKVTLVIRGDAVLKGFDHDVRSHLTQEMVRSGMTILAGAAVDRIERAGTDIRAHLHNSVKVLEADHILYAVGRIPNTGGLGLRDVGVELGPLDAVAVDEWSRTNVDGIYAVGDVTNRKNLTPVAIAEARAFAETAFNDNPTRFDPSRAPTAVFSMPPVATVGLSETESRQRGHAIDVYHNCFRPLKHTLSGSNRRVMMKLVVDRASDMVLGCHMVGADAAEIMQGLAIALECGATKTQFDRTVGIHPSSAEEFVTMREPSQAPPDKHFRANV
ncbi:glutathione-disulfide reductase [Bradyrhizobium sp. CCBAU 25338]|uniref:glutathione-disulfide reductase n=1 Tax=Bradyrhizobium sp. CCBAU 25338 TaxID=1641877 RepID=UPI002303E8B3|nr:glutathione-disulfide reductase [Bradyrhizobium sp. CCBAU 25338]MDA9529045.1 glutathione reductase [Bradyrhizobium sp. CCBAU 25338]